MCDALVKKIQNDYGKLCDTFDNLLSNNLQQTNLPDNRSLYRWGPMIPRIEGREMIPCTEEWSMIPRTEGRTIIQVHQKTLNIGQYDSLKRIGYRRQ